MSFELASSQAIIDKAGANANSVAIASDALVQRFADQAQATFCTRTRRDWVTEIGDVKTNFVQMISDAVSDLAAMKIINYDMSGYSGKREAETMLDVLNDNSFRIIKDLVNKEYQEVLI